MRIRRNCWACGRQCLGVGSAIPNFQTDYYLSVATFSLYIIFTLITILLRILNIIINPLLFNKNLQRSKLNSYTLNLIIYITALQLYTFQLQKCFTRVTPVVGANVVLNRNVLDKVCIQYCCYNNYHVIVYIITYNTCN